MLSDSNDYNHCAVLEFLGTKGVVHKSLSAEFRSVSAAISIERCWLFCYSMQLRGGWKYAGLGVYRSLQGPKSLVNETFFFPLKFSAESGNDGRLHSLCWVCVCECRMKFFLFFKEGRYEAKLPQVGNKNSGTIM